MSEQQPVYSIEKVYLKDLSLEVPGAPQVFSEQQAPKVDMSLHNEARALDANGTFEVVLTATVTAKVQEKTLFLVEAAQAGLFVIRGMPQEDMEILINVICPGILLPYARETVSTAIVRAGFPPVLLPHVGFDAIYQQKREQAQQAGAAPAPQAT